MHENRATVFRGPPGEVLRHACTQVENPMRAAFEKYGEIPKTVPLDFTEDGATWLASKLSGTEGALGAEAIELRNYLFRFRCSLEELRVVVARLADWMANSSPPWAA